METGIPATFLTLSAQNSWKAKLLGQPPSDATWWLVQGHYKNPRNIFRKDSILQKSTVKTSLRENGWDRPL